jgi:hypothetical protein
MLSGSGFRGFSEASGGNSSSDSPSDYPVVQLRSIENEQTSFLLVKNWSTNSFVSYPVNGLPLGYALATVFVNGVPSPSAILSIDSPPIILTSETMLPNGAFQFGFDYTSGASCTALATTDVSKPLTNWTALGSATEISYGHYQFTDLSAPFSQQRLYNVRSP